MSDRKEHWEAVYRNKSPLEVSWYQKAPTLSLQLIRNSGIAVDEPIIDVGGGASILVDTLSDAGYSNLSVLDLSSTALSHAQNRLGDQAKSITWYEADITQFIPSTTFSLWHDRAVFHFLTNAEDRRRYVEVLTRGLRPGGHLVIAAFAIGGPTRCSNLEIVQYDTEKMGNILGGEFELIETQQELHQTPAEKEQLFGYFHWIRRSALSEAT